VSAYRFCRTDDVSLLVEAHNLCCARPGEATAMTAADFKRAVKELDLWASSCMVALEGDEPVGVLMSAKRNGTSLIFRIGVREDHRRRGHGRHLLSSLARKLAILGPPGIVAEVPLAWPGARSFFATCGYVETARYADFVRRPPFSPSGSDGIVNPALADVVESGAFDPEIPRSWERDLRTLSTRSAELRGLAVASDVRMEAWLLARETPSAGVEIAALGHAGGEAGGALLRALVERLGAERNEPITVSRIGEREVPFSLLEEWGFERAAEYSRCEAVASEG
jgi:GNAT superfamily N-acetyltransferase